MIDSVLKGTGNSRFLKSAVPAGTSWADALAMLQAGTFPIDFNGINTAGFQQVGTPLNKANLLKDATAAQIGLLPSTTPDGMFQALGNTGELHVWRKTARDASVSAPGYNLGDRTSADICQNTAGNTGDFGVNVEYASEITVDNNGVISLTSPVAIVLKFNGKTSTFSPTNAANAMKNKFLKIVSVSDDNPSATILKSYKGTVFHCESDFNCYGYGNSSPGYIIYLSSVKPVTSYPAGFAHTYPVSTNPKAYQEGDDAKAAGYTLGDAVEGTFKASHSYDRCSATYGDALSVADDGTISIKNGTTSRTWSTIATAIKGKFVHFNNTASDSDIPEPFRSNTIVFVPSDANTKYGSDSSGSTYLFIYKYQPVTSYAAIPAGTTIEYLGRLGDKARVQVVSYVGTGTYGENNKNSLTFDFPPKILLIAMAQLYSNQTYTGILYPFVGYGSCLLGADRGYVYSLLCNRNGNSVSWWSEDDYGNQLNISGYKYTAIAIG